MSKFTDNQEVQIGNKENLPDGWLTPIPARVICTDAKGLHAMSVIVLAQPSPKSPFESMRQFDADGLCLNALVGKGNPNAALYLESNLYPRD